MMETFNNYIGQIFDRRYKIVKIIGVGGMAVVFEAVDMVMKRTVAVKMLREEISNDAQSVKRFINESKAVSMLSHDNIVSIYDVSVKENLKYIVMELVDGITLKNYMNQRGALPTEELLRYTEQILRALEHAHSKGIIHRDIKPQNIMLLKNGRIKVADFGIAKLPNAETVTMTDKAIGTVFYISPEQASGKKIDPRSDLYSLGVVMYEMATGQLPFNAESPVSVALMQVSKQPRPPREINPNIPVGLEQLILGAMEKNPDRRLQSARQMLRPVTQLLSNPNSVFKVRQTQNGKNVRKNTSPAKSTGSSGNSQSGKKKTQSRSMLPIIMGVTLAFLLVLGVTGYYILSLIIQSANYGDGEQVTIEQFVGKNYNVISEEEKIRKYYDFTIENEYDSDKEVGLITAQDPESGKTTKLARGEKIEMNITVNFGEKVFTMPTLRMSDYRAAQIELRESGMSLTVNTVGEANDNIPYGYVIRTEPAEGTVLTPGAAVTLIYSTGAEYERVPMPDFVGKTTQEAMNLLIENDLDYGAVTYEPSDKYEKGIVISQSIQPNTEVAAGVTKVDFVVSSGKTETSQKDED